MATISGCQNIAAWLEESPVMSDTEVWQGSLQAVLSQHPVTIISSDLIINYISHSSCAARLTHTHTHPPLQEHKHTTLPHSHTKAQGDAEEKKRNKE